MSDDIKSILIKELPSEFKISALGKSNAPPENQEDVDIRLREGAFPGDKFWVTNMYVDVRDRKIVLKIYLTFSAWMTLEAKGNLKLLCKVGDNFSQIGMTQIEVKNQRDGFSWEIDTSKKELAGVLNNIIASLRI